MAYAVSDPSLGAPAIGTSVYAVSDGYIEPMLGKIVRAIDPTYGEGEFILLKGVGSTIVGSQVRFNTTDWTTQLVGTSDAETGAPVAYAMAANTSASNAAWYQIGGLAVVKKTAVAVSPGVAVYISGTAGRIKVIGSTGKQIVGARSANLATISAGASTVVLQINRPHIAGFES